MKKYFDVTISTRKENSKGKLKKVKEKYIVDAMTFTEAESKITTEIRMMYNEFEIENINPFKVCEIIGAGNQKFFISIILIEDIETSKVLQVKNLINADNIDDAKEITDSDLMQYDQMAIGVKSISETKFIDIF